MASTIRRPRRLPGVTSDLRPQPRIPDFIASTIVKPRAGMTDADAIAQMASDMQEACVREGGMTREDLELLGFTADQIDRCAAKARARAQRLSHVAV